MFSCRKAGIISCLLSWALSIAVSDYPQISAGQYRLLPHAYTQRSPHARYSKVFHARESGFRNPGKFCLWNLESWALDSGAQGIRNPTKDWNPESKFHWQRVESSLKRGRLSSFIGETEAECTLCGRDLALKKVKLTALPSAIEWSIYSKLGPHNILELFKWSLFMAAFRNIEIHKWLHKFLKMYETFTGRKATINPL